MRFKEAFIDELIKGGDWKPILSDPSFRPAHAERPAGNSMDPIFKMVHARSLSSDPWPEGRRAKRSVFGVNRGGRGYLGRELEARYKKNTGKVLPPEAPSWSGR